MIVIAKSSSRTGLHRLTQKALSELFFSILVLSGDSSTTEERNAHSRNPGRAFLIPYESAIRRAFGYGSRSKDKGVTSTLI